MRYFQLVRKHDVSGVSGTGVVAEGCEFHDGQIALSWFGQHHVIGVYPRLKDVIAIHGHQGSTYVEWIKTTEPCRCNRLLCDECFTRVTQQKEQK